MFTRERFLYPHSGGGSVVINVAQAERGEEECLMSRKNLFPILHERLATNHNHTALFKAFFFFFPSSPPSSCNLEAIAWEITPYDGKAKLRPVDILRWIGVRWDEAHVWVAGCSVWGLVFEKDLRIFQRVYLKIRVFIGTNPQSSSLKTTSSCIA